MKINLYTTFYVDNNLGRFSELLHCVNKNIADDLFDSVNFLVENENDSQVLQRSINCSEKIKIDILGRRPSFNDFFSKIESNDEINVVSNSDIYFDKESIQSIKAFFSDFNKSNCLALSRWDVQPDGSAIHFDRSDSQDTWIFLGKPMNMNIEFTMGVAGCDNRLANDLSIHYNVLNPSKSIKTYHYHNSEVRNYIPKDGTVMYRIPPPYKLITPY